MKMKPTKKVPITNVKEAQKIIQYAEQMVKEGKGLKLINDDGTFRYRIPCPCCQGKEDLEIGN